MSKTTFPNFKVSLCNIGKVCIAGTMIVSTITGCAVAIVDGMERVKEHRNKRRNKALRQQKKSKSKKKSGSK